MNNYVSTKLHCDQVEKQIKTEIAEGRYVVSQEKPHLISALGAIPKESGGIRLIHDCSQPEGLSLNDYVRDTFKLKYQTVKSALEHITPGCYLAKVDLQSAYRSVGLHPSQSQFTGIKWKFSGEKDYTYLYDRSLPFGAKKSPGIFHRLTQSVRRMMKRRGYTVIAYLDDFLLIAETHQQCLDGLNTLLCLLRALGFSIAWNKTEGPTTSLIFLGVLINTNSMSLHLPEQKVQKLKSLLACYLTMRRASLRQLQELAGKLSWASHVVCGGRVYLQRIFNTLRPLRLPHHKVKLSSEFRADVEWWLAGLDIFNTKHIISHKSQAIPIFTDACTAGAGMVMPLDWAYIDWDLDAPALSAEHINVKETMAVILAIYRWAPCLQNSKVTVFTDNTTTRANINKGACKNPRLMHHLRHLFWLSCIYNFDITCLHIPGASNLWADSISRLRSPGHFMYWNSVCTAGAPLSDCAVYFENHVSPQALSFLLSQAKNIYSS